MTTVSLVMTQSFCNQCLQKLGMLVKYEKEISEIKQQISSFLQRFASDVEDSRKRTLPSESQTPQPKRFNSHPKRITDPSKVSVCETVIRISFCI